MANYSVKAENKWRDGFARPVCLVLGTPRTPTAERHKVEVASAVSNVDLSLNLREDLFTLNLGSASEELLRHSVGDNVMIITASVIVWPYVSLFAHTFQCAMMCKLATAT